LACARLLEYERQLLLGLALAVCATAIGCNSQPEVVRTDEAQGGASPFDTNGSTRGGAGQDEPVAPTTPALTLPSVLLPGSNATTDFAFVPGTRDQLVVLNHPGQLLHYRFVHNGVKELGRTSIPETHHHDGCGLLSIVFDPEFEDNEFVYIARCVTLTRIAIARYRLLPIGELAQTETPVLTVEQDTQNGEWHRFGSMGFEPDGETMWVLLGDFTEPHLGQDTSQKPGSLLRLKPNRQPDGSGYEQASGNAFNNRAAGDPDIYAYGIRSPWRGSRDRFGRFWIGDVGDTDREEVNLVTHAGQNFGWDHAEGACSADCEWLTDPVVSYGRKSDEAYSIEDPRTEPATKRAVWVGQAYDHPEDRYYGLFDDSIVFGDYFSGWVRRLQVDEAGRVVSDLSVGHLTQVTSWKTGPDGYMYALTHGARLHRAEQVTE
jgi:hypothetical protein